MPSLQDRFLSGELDGALRVMQGLGYEGNEYTPIKASLLSQSQIRKIFDSNTELIHLKSLWMANVGRNGTSVHIEREMTERSKDRFQKLLYRVLYSDLRWSDLHKQIISKIFEEGNAVVWHNDEGQPVVESIFRFNVYKDDMNKRARYAYIDPKTNTEAPGLQNLVHGEDVWHIKDPMFADRWIAPPRVNLALAFLILENNGVKANSKLFANGLIGTILLKMNPEATKDPKLTTPDENGVTGIQRRMREIWDSMTGVSKSNQVHPLSWLEQVFEPGKDNKSMQFVDLLKDVAPERIAWAWNITLADLGSGDNTTYNNTQTFSYVLYEKIGRHLEEAEDDLRNEFLLPKAGYPTANYGDIYVQYDKPSNPDRINYQEQARHDWLANLITLNEYRDSQDLSPVDDGDVYYKDWVVSTAPAPDDTTDTAFAVKKNETLSFAKGTPTDKALKSKDYRRFEKRWGDSLTKQLNEFLERFSEVSDDGLENYEVKLKKIETFYSFPTLKKDISKFAKRGLDLVKKDKRVKFKNIADLRTINFADDPFGQFPDIVKEWVEQRTAWVLKGGEFEGMTFAGVDEATTQEISNLIKDNLSKGAVEIAKIITERIPELVRYRSERIARTEVANAVEGSQFVMYKQEFGEKGTITWQTAQDEDVRASHAGNNGKTVQIGETFPNGNTRPGQDVNCRCTALYEPGEDY